MRVIIEKNYYEMSRKAALLLSSQLNLKPNSVLGLATGSTPLGMYRELINMYQHKELDFSEVITFNLDEYYKLSKENEKSYYYYMHNNFFKHVNIPSKNIHFINAKAENIVEECKTYEEKIKQAGGLDLQILGIGPNGHIGFNEPGKTLNVATHLVNLSEETISANSRFFNSVNEVPHQAISIGMAAIMKARRILLLANGRNKAEAIEKAVSGYLDTKYPASILQTHPEVTIIIDEEAARLIKKDNS